eukprot:5574522-Amphidinium_carterae.1
MLWDCSPCNTRIRHAQYTVMAIYKVDGGNQLLRSSHNASLNDISEPQRVAVQSPKLMRTK